MTKPLTLDQKIPNWEALAPEESMPGEIGENIITKSEWQRIKIALLDAEIAKNPEL